ncbi:MAG: uroporphyrinogen-III C-methyltransferase [Ferroplasma sp.]
MIKSIEEFLPERLKTYIKSKYHKMGRAYIVGFGPGNMKLLTLRAMELIKAADVIIYDHLLNLEFLNYIKSDCVKIYVGKKPYKKRITQEEINTKIIENCLKYETVVRLKGGDPFLFGRGGEEIEELIANGIEYEIVPGVSALVSVPAYSGIPVTHRDVNHGIIVTTGNNVENLNLPKCNGFNRKFYTLVIFMGAANLNKIIKKLIESGYSSDTDIAIIANGTYNYQKTFTGTLENISYDYDASPALIVVGDTVKYHKYFNLIEKKPFAGNIITVMYSTEMPDLSCLENTGFTILKLRVEALKFRAVNTAALTNKNIMISGNYVEYFMDFLKENRIDIKKTGKIITDSNGSKKFEEYCIFDTFAIDSYIPDGSEIRIDMDSRNDEIYTVEKQILKIDDYLKDYIMKSSLIVVLDSNCDPAKDICELKNIDRIYVNYPYSNLANRIIEHSGGRAIEEN